MSDLRTHRPCPAHVGQWFNSSTGDCSCGSNHHNYNRASRGES